MKKNYCTIILAILLTCSFGKTLAQGSFSFIYEGPTVINVGADCMATLDWGQPNTPIAISNVNGGEIVSFEVSSITGGYQPGDPIPPGELVTILYQAIDNFNNSAFFGFSISIVDTIPPVFDQETLPADTQIGCIDDLLPPPEVTGSDNCMSEEFLFSITFSESGSAEGCGGGVITRTWVADDDLGNQTTYIQTITVTPDTELPVITVPPEDGSGECEDAMNLYTQWLEDQRNAFTATDDGCGIMEYTDNAPPANILVSFCGDVPVQFSATDFCGKTVTITATFSITNSVPPTISVPASNGSGNCTSGNPSAAFQSWLNTQGGAMAEDDCGTVDWSTIPDNPTLGDTCGGEIIVQFVVDDGCGNTSVTAASYFVTDTVAPTIQTQAVDRIINCTSFDINTELGLWLTNTGNAEASDLCTPADDLQIGFQIGETVYDSAGVFEVLADSMLSGCVDGVNIGGLIFNDVLAILDVNFVFSDACGNSTSTQALFAITDGVAPSIDSMAQDMIMSCDTSAGLEASFMAWFESAGGAIATDDCGPVFWRGEPTFEVALAQLNAVIDTSCGEDAVVSVSFFVNDLCGNENNTPTIASFGIIDTIAPMLTQTATDLVFNCDTSAQLALQNWLDNNGGAQAVDDCASLAWSFEWQNAEGDTISGLAEVGPYPQLSELGCDMNLEIMFQASDFCNNLVGASASFILIDTVAPIIMLDQDTIQSSCDSIPMAGDLNVSDDCGSASVTIFFTDSILVNNDTSVCAMFNQTILRQWTATDPCGNQSQATEVIVISDQEPPTFILPPDTVINCVSLDSLELTGDISAFMDNCDPDPSRSFADEITGEGCNFTILRTWTVSDVCGNSATGIQTIMVVDEEAPVIVQMPVNIEIQCDISMDVDSLYNDWVANFANSEFADNCSDVEMFIAIPGSYDLGDSTSYPGQSLPGLTLEECNGSDGVVAQVSADIVYFDACYNAQFVTVQFMVRDTMGPVLTGCTDTLQIVTKSDSCIAAIDITPPFVDDNCNPPEHTIDLEYQLDEGERMPLGAMTSLQLSLAPGSYQLFWFARDCAGNESECMTTIIVRDEEPPFLSCLDNIQSVLEIGTCSQDVSFEVPASFGDNCGIEGSLRYSITGASAQGEENVPEGATSLTSGFTSGLSTVHYTISDVWGNTNTCSFDVLIQDQERPRAQCKNATIFINPSGVVDYSLTFEEIDSGSTDNCMIDSVQIVPNVFDCSQAGTMSSVQMIVFDQSGNSDTCNTEIRIEIALIIPSYTVDICENDTLQLLANVPDAPGNPYTFSWSGPVNFTSNLENPTILNVDTSYSGSYTLVVTGFNGCTSSGSVDVIISNLNSASLFAESEIICTGESVELQSISYSEPVTYSWYRGVPPNGLLLGTSVNPSFSDNPPSTGTFEYYVIVESAACTTNPSSTETVEVIEIPQAMVSQNQIELCEGEMIVLESVNVGAGLTYQWSGPDGFSSSAQIPEAIIASEVKEGLYSLIVLRGDCASEPVFVDVIVNPKPDLPIIDGEDLYCNGGQLILSVENLSNADRYFWIDPEGAVIPTTSNTLVIDDISNTVAGSWQVIMEVSDCLSDTSVIFEVNLEVEFDVQIQNPGAVCEGDEITLGVSQIIPGAVYSWEGPEEFTGEGPNQSLTPAIEGTYSLTVITPAGCEIDASTFVEVNTAPIVTAISNSAGNCANGADDVVFVPTIFSPEGGPYTYMWTGPNFSSTDSMPMIENFTSANNGTYYLVVFKGDCPSEIDSTIVNVSDAPDMPSIFGEQIFCEGENLILATDLITGESVIYHWVTPLGNFDIIGDSIFTIPDVELTAVGSYVVSIENDGCPSVVSDTFEVQIISEISQPEILAPSKICEDDSLRLELIGGPVDGAIYQWTGPANFSSSSSTPFIYPVTPDAQGNYFVQIQIGPCSSPESNSFFVEVVDMPSPPVIELTDQQVCLDSPSPLQLCIDDTATIAGATYYWFNLDNGTALGSTVARCLTIDDFSSFSNGENSIAVQVEVDGCRSVTSAVISIPMNGFPAEQADAGGDAAICFDDSPIVVATPGIQSSGMWSSVTGSSFFFSPDSAVSEVKGLEEGENLLIWSLSFGACKNFSSDTVSIFVEPFPIVNDDTVFVDFGQSTNFNVIFNDLLPPGYSLTITGAPGRGNALHQGDGDIVYVPNIGYVGEDEMTYMICSDACPDQCDMGTVFIQVGDENDCFVPSIFTPNNDGVNDMLIVPCLETVKFPDSRIIIFNQWGDEVYSAQPYRNNWEGRRNGEDLPVSTYFYVLDFGDGTDVRKGFLILER